MAPGRHLHVPGVVLVLVGEDDPLRPRLLEQPLDLVAHAVEADVHEQPAHHVHADAVADEAAAVAGEVDAGDVAVDLDLAHAVQVTPVHRPSGRARRRAFAIARGRT